MSKQIYAIQHNVTKRIYIGQSSCAEIRIKKHMRHLLSGKHSNLELQKDFDNYGMEFSFFLIEDDVDESVGNEREKYWMHIFNSNDKRTGYNLSENQKNKKELDDFERIYLKVVRGNLCDVGISEKVKCKSNVRKNTPKSFLKLEELANAKGITLYALALKLGFARSLFSDWKSGKSMPKTDKLLKIAEYFGVTVDYFIGS